MSVRWQAAKPKSEGPALTEEAGNPAGAEELQETFLSALACRCHSSTVGAMLQLRCPARSAASG